MTAGKIRVLLADDERLLRAGIRLVLRHAEDIEVIAEADDGSQAVELACQMPVDVVLMDIRMPGTDGLTAAEQMAERAPGVKVVMLTTFGEHDYITRALRGGAVGFILKDTGPQELIQAVRAAAHGGAILSPRITKDLIDQHVTTNDTRTTEARRLVSDLTDRERQVLVLIGLGTSNAEAARRLYMGEGTVKTYVSRILAKLGCANRVQAAIIAHDAGMLPTR
ncbi:DNA-binding NarL/FixJ family response regulator [Kibdelosporangium banguiense]|uniref:DNA-binding NarL/FixJ family response regulator n=1 Tax=Kibdelosporangium banguiense TaxID=1365924 RepID=A0ABS4U1E7_9PSEU|nr:response regulator transcription factor [Kibdelosporangium banguiense]MBP2330460.1 DNA-binding NarL/FixJ family response regulator [Kibdelosporangium banguiense]